MGNSNSVAHYRSMALGTNSKAEPLFATDIKLKNGKLDLDNRDLCLLTQHIGEYVELKWLTLAHNQLVDLPWQLGCLRHITRLDISYNKISVLPESMGELCSLTYLEASNNQLSGLPTSIGRISNLQYLGISNNMIEEIPGELGQCVALQVLKADSNKLPYLPAEISRLTQLRQIDIRNNPLVTELPSDPLVEPPSLVETVCRWFVRHGIYYNNDAIPKEIRQYMGTARTCSMCGGPYFKTHVKRLRFYKVDEVRVPLVSNLCMAHWNTDQQRVARMFEPLPRTAPSPFNSPRGTARAIVGSPWNTKGQKQKVSLVEIVQREGTHIPRSGSPLKSSSSSSMLARSFTNLAIGRKGARGHRHAASMSSSSILLSD
eukprot:comp18294_c0_seq1/m.19329 comp18294_c0_seq1/g.19329  ORF comp18294_c0_seq1/g.19329 comp18294_c0_seq1/m.19329 type:complete len:374 (-) comp18294_c0_seq1:151-1272(-)